MGERWDGRWRWLTFGRLDSEAADLEGERVSEGEKSRALGAHQEAGGERQGKLPAKRTKGRTGRARWERTYDRRPLWQVGKSCWVRVETAGELRKSRGGKRTAEVGKIKSARGASYASLCQTHNCVDVASVVSHIIILDGDGAVDQAQQNASHRTDQQNLLVLQSLRRGGKPDAQCQARNCAVERRR